MPGFSARSVSVTPRVTVTPKVSSTPKTSGYKSSISSSHSHAPIYIPFLMDDDDDIETVAVQSQPQPNNDTNFVTDTVFPVVTLVIVFSLLGFLMWQLIKE